MQPDQATLPLIFDVDPAPARPPARTEPAPPEPTAPARPGAGAAGRTTRGRAKPRSAPSASAQLEALAVAPLEAPVGAALEAPAATAAALEAPVGAALEAPAAENDGVVVFDVETTGTDRRRDQIIELCVQFGIGDDVASRTWRFKPEVAMSPGAQAVHGISIEDLADAPPFAACADEIAAVFASARVLVGYNLTFDIEMVQAEYERLERPPLDLSGKTIVDAFRLWQQSEPRSLQHAHQRFVGQGFAAAHSASADVAATGRVLSGMLTAFGLEGRDWTSIASVCDPDGRLKPASRASWVGPSRHLQWNDDGDIVMTFGKHASVALHLVARNDRDYVRWVTGKDFPEHVIEVCRFAIDNPGEGELLVTWARKRYGQAAPTVDPAFGAR